MKNLVQSLVLVIVLASSAIAATYTATVSTGTNSFIAGQYRISSISVQSATANVLNFYDSPTNRVTYTTSLYSNRVSYLTNLNVVVTNSGGYLYTNYLTGMFTTVISVPANTNLYPTVATVLPTAGVSVTAPVDLTIMRGLAVTATNSATVTITYH